MKLNNSQTELPPESNPKEALIPIEFAGRLQLGDKWRKEKGGKIIIIRQIAH